MTRATLKAALVAAALALPLAANAQDSPYIPNNGVSDSCAAFLARLDSHPELARCSSNLLAATSLFDPSSSSASSSNSNANAVDSTLARLCSPASQCSKSTITQALTWFSGNCTAELAANQPLVRSNYDVLYVLYPFTRAACTKDPKSSEYCATRVTDEDAAKAAPSASSNSSAFANTPSNSTASSSSGLFVQAPSIALSNLYVHIADAARGAVSRLRRRQATQSQGTNAAGSVPSTVANATSTTNGNAVTAENALLPNATTFRESGLPFLFLSGEMGQSQLCTECTKEILAAYVGFETDFPYGSGLSNSPILGAQASLWNDMGKVCGSGFLSAITSQSGSNSFSAAPKAYTAAGGVLALAAAGLAGFVALL